MQLRRYLKHLLSIGALLCSLLLSPITQANAPKSQWLTGVSWGEAASRWELQGGERKLRPDSFRFTVGKSNLWTAYQSSDWIIALDVEGNLYHWDDPWRQRDISAASLLPIFRAKTPFYNGAFFVGLGIGAAVLDSDEWMDRELGSHLQFEDRIEIGLRYSQHQVALGLSHFSNANLADINHGVNVYHVSYSYYW